MLRNHPVSLPLFAGSLLLAPSIAFAQDATAKANVPLEKTIGQVTPTGPVPSLAVLNSAGARLNGGKLILSGVASNVIVFADRPVRAAGHVATEQFIMQWDAGKNSFAADPPNATVSVLGGDGSKVSDAVVTLKSPHMADGTLTFDVAVLEGSLDGGAGPVAVFIDAFAGHFGGVHAGGFGVDRPGGLQEARYGVRDSAYWHAPAYRGAWYGASAAVGAGAAAGLATDALYDNAYYGYSARSQNYNGYNGYSGICQRNPALAVCN
jgi:hypothetical protein